MRRFASVFASKRDRHPPSPPADPPTKRPGALNTAPPTPGLTDPAVSSASSSSGSASLYLHTPEDDNHNVTIVAPHHQQQEKPLQQSSKKSWKSWLKSTTIKPPPVPWQHKPVSDWTPPAAPQINDSDEQDDSESDAYDDEDEPSTTTNALPPSPARAFTSFRNLVQNSLAPPNSGPTPFTQRSDAQYLFPRSCNPPRQLPREYSMRSTMLKTRLFSQCEEAATRGPTPSEQLSIASLASRLIPPSTPVSPPSPLFDEPALSKTTVISLTSRGLRRWISRPCFEDRYAVLVPEGDSVVRQRVTGGALAVAALEYSEAIDAMIDFNLGEAEPLPPPAPALVIEIPSPAVEPPTVVLSPTSPSSSQTTGKNVASFGLHICADAT